MSETEDGLREVYADESALTYLLGDHPKVKILVSLLSENDSPTPLDELEDLAGLHATTIRENTQSLIAMNVVEESEDSGALYYQINRQSQIASKLGGLEWEVIDLVSEVDEE